MPEEDSHAKAQEEAQAAPLEAEPRAEIVALPAAPALPATSAEALAAKEAVVVASAFDMLGTDDLPTISSPPPVASSDSDEVAPDPALFYNPFSAVAPTANDEANQQTAVELRRRQRAAIKAKSAEQIVALSTLYKK